LFGLKLLSGGPSTGRAIAVKVLIDTGATLHVVPRKIAEELQLPVIGRRRAATAKGVAELDECNRHCGGHG
jgi:predicted aspartyl protease